MNFIVCLIQILFFVPQHFAWWNGTALSIDPPHPIHISVSHVDISSHEIHWSARIYTDDLLLGVYGREIDASMFDDRARTEQDIFAFIVKNIRVTADGANMKWKLKEVTSDPEAIWITVSAPLSGGSISKLSIHNRILLDIYSDQKNIVNLNWGSGKTNLVFERGKEKKEVAI